jgi:hypothetical protein
MQSLVGLKRSIVDEALPASGKEDAAYIPPALQKEE